MKLIGQLALAVVALGAGSGCGGDTGERNQPARNPPNANAIPVRAELDRLLELTTRAGESDEQRATELFYQGLARLMVASERDEVGFVRELIDFEVAAVAARNEKAAALAILAQHISSASKSQTLQAVLPYLTKSDDATQQVVNRLLGRIEDASGGRPPDFRHYPLRDDSESGLALIEHMFRRSPDDALQSFVLAVYQDERRKPLLWARHVVDDALWKRQNGFVPAKEPDAVVTRELEKMAGRDEWWARLYAAEIIRQHPEFGKDELVKRLADDPHPLVQKTAKTIRPPIRK
ncbi:MAG: hypothetical protein WD063_05955 [Pirellulales bacterium]